MLNHRCVSLVLWLGLAASAALANSAGPKAGLTGGFSEGTCITCHSSGSLNEGRSRGGIFQIDGVPRAYEPGKSYAVTLLIGQPGQSRWGFELSARFADTGKQAGKWVVDDAKAQLRGDAQAQYVTHTAEGTRAGEKDGAVEFRVNWVAPSELGGLILFNAAGNAADGSNSPTGDFIYTAGNFSKPAPPAPAPAAATQAAKAAAEPEPVEVSATEVKAPVRVQEDSRLIDLPSPVDLKKGSMEILIQHRFFESIGDAGMGDAWGIDSGANIALAFNYAVSNRLSLGVSRVRTYKAVTFGGTYEIHTAKESPWKMSLTGGVEGRQNFQEQYSPYLQLVTSLDRGPFRLNLVPTMVFNSRPPEASEFPPGDVINPGSNHTFSLGIGTDIALTKRISLLGEYVPRLAGYGGLYERNDHYGAGVAIRTWGHVFSILVASSPEFNPSQYGVNAGRRDVSLGFNIYRRIR